jgi:hypothetical protein
MSKNSTRQPWSVPCSAYYTGSDFLTVYINRNERHLVKFHPDLDAASRQTIIDGIHANVGMFFRFKESGDLIEPKYSKK